MDRYPFESADQPSIDAVAPVVPVTWTRGGAPSTFTTACSWTQGYVALDTQTRGFFIVAASDPNE